LGSFWAALVPLLNHFWTVSGPFLDHFWIISISFEVPSKLQTVPLLQIIGVGFCLTFGIGEMGEET
jgi:hypothetical protein